MMNELSGGVHHRRSGEQAHNNMIRENVETGRSSTLHRS